MPNVRMMPPNGAAGTITVNGRTYSCGAGATIDVPDFDHFVMSANGWVNAAGAGNSVLPTVGGTSARPNNPKFGQTYHDSTINLTITWDGKAWRNPATGAAV